MSAGSEFSIRTATSADAEAIRAVVFPALVEHGLTPDPTGPDADLNNIDVNFFGAGGWFEVLEDGDGEIVGSVGLRPYRGQRRKAELRKMYLKPSMRGRGLGRMLLERALQKARDLGFEEIWLETNSKLARAIRLYESYGFKAVNEPIVSPRCDHVYMQRL